MTEREPDPDAPASPRARRWRRVGYGIAGVIVLAGLWWVQTGRSRSASDRRACQNDVEEEWVRGGPECLHMQVYRSALLTTRPDLVVVLHGDSPFSGPSYQYAAARRLAAMTGNVIAVGLLRPGYTDAEGNRSSGVRGHATGDNYTPGVVDAIADAIDRLANSYLPGHVILVGHSGGAAVAGDVIGRRPELVAGAVLISCPCDVPAWRQHMAAAQHLPLWRLPVTSLSPMDLAAKVAPQAVVRVVVGTADTVAPASFSRAYVQRLEGRGVHAQLLEIPGAAHDILLDPRVLTAIVAAIAAVDQTLPAS